MFTEWHSRHSGIRRNVREGLGKSQNFQVWEFVGYLVYTIVRVRRLTKEGRLVLSARCCYR